MCESKAILVKGGDEEVIMEDVVYMSVTDDKVVLRDVAGNEKVCENVKLSRVDFLAHAIYLEPA